MNRSILAACAAALLLCTGCGDDEPAAGPAPTTSATATESSATPDPGPVEPTLPVAAQRDGKAGAEAFVEHYWATVNYAQETGDTRHLRSLGGPSCSLCTGGADWIDKVTESGGHVDGGRNTVRSTTGAKPPAAGGLWVVDAELSTDSARVRSNDPGLRKRYPAARETFRFSLRFDEDQWLITDWREV